MPNRTVRESICANELLDRLTAEEERCWSRLRTACDDYGRFDGRAGVVLGRCFPLMFEQHQVQAGDAERWLQGMAAKGVIQLYVVNGVRYLQMLVWDEKPRAKESKYPSPLGWLGDPIPHGSADLPVGTATGMPTLGAEQGAVPARGTKTAATAGIGDGALPVRQTAAYREFEEICQDCNLQQWIVFHNFDQLHAAITAVAERDWTVLHEVAREAATAANRTPGVRYGLSIIKNLPAEIQTREQARAHFEAGRKGGSPPGVPPRDDSDAPPSEEEDEIARRLRLQRGVKARAG